MSEQTSSNQPVSAALTSGEADLRALAIIGMAGRFPGAEDIENFWEALRDARELRRDFGAAAPPHPEHAPSGAHAVRSGYVIPNIDQFDAEFFEMTPREAAYTDPQHRLLLECAYAALEDAGYVDERAGRIGVFASANFNTYLFNVCRSVDYADIAKHLEVVIGNDKDYLATRISYKLDLTGPSLAVQTACSSSLVALAAAASALLDHQCDLALVGGVGLRAVQETGYFVRSGEGVLSEDGVCRPFDARSSGFVEGNGVGVLVLRRLGDAVAARDSVRAVIRGFAVNNDGSAKVGYTAPSVAGQASVIEEALAVSGVEPATVTYLEAHGTGTPLGDPIEAEALGRVYGASAGGRAEVGSVKSNIGHLDAAAGVASVIKATLALQHGFLPATLHFERPNPEARLDELGFSVCAAGHAWSSAPGVPRRAAVSSLGIGGTNAHVVLEQAPAVAERAAARELGGSPSAAAEHELGRGGEPQLLVISGRTPSAREQVAVRLAAHLERHPELDWRDVAHTLRAGRRAFGARRCALATSPADVGRVLTDPTQYFEATVDAKAASARLAFLFPGAGPQYAGMGEALYRSDPLYRQVIDECAVLARTHAGIDLAAVLYGSAGSHGSTPAEPGWTDMRDPVSGFLALFATELALARWFMARGITPSCVFGHSLGEYAAAHLAGVFSLEQAMLLLVLRGRLFERAPEGSMLAVALPESDLEAWLEPGIWLAAVNGARACVVAGARRDVARFEAKLRANGIDVQPIAVALPAHTPLLAPLVDDLRAYLRSQALGAPTLPIASNVSGGWLSAEQACDPEYWVEHLLRPVRFDACVRTVLGAPGRVVLQVGPGQGLIRLVQERVDRGQRQAALAGMPGEAQRSEAAAFALTAVGRAWLAGVDVDWEQPIWRREARRVPLPTYPFERRRHWIDAPAEPPIAVESAPALWIPSFRRASRSPVAASECRARRWLVFDLDELGVGQHVAEALRACEADVLEVKPGASYRRVDGNVVQLRPDEPSQLERLLRELAEQGRWPDVIVLPSAVAPIAAGGVTRASLEAAWSVAASPLAALAQALAGMRERRSLRIGLISNNMLRVLGDEPVEPVKALALGIARTLPHELPEIDCLHVDLQEAGGPVGEATVRAILAECVRTEVPRHVPSIAIRGCERWDLEFQRLPASDAPPAPSLREGVYLVTGGLGGIGSTLAAELARLQPGIRLALLSRGEVPPPERWTEVEASADAATVERVRRVRALEELGAAVRSFAVDVADRSAMAAALAEIRRWGPIRGVVHAAGVVGGGLLHLGDQRRAEDNLRPKVLGCLVLDQLLAEDELDWFVVCSSVGAHTGALGQADNVAANCFFDAFADAKASRAARSGRARPVVRALDWDYWLDVGLMVRLRERHRAVAGSDLEQGLTADDGARCFRRALGLAHPQIVVAARDFERLLETTRTERGETLSQFEGAQLPVAESTRPELAVPFVAPRDALETALAELWEQALGTRPVGVRDDFRELGGQSLSALPLVARIRETFHVALSIRDFFAASTVASLADHLRRSESAPGQCLKIATLLQAVRQMSSAQVRRALADRA